MRYRKRRAIRPAILLLLALALAFVPVGQWQQAPEGLPPAAQLLSARCVWVIDGDTAIFEIEGLGRETVRFIGVDSPEMATQEAPAEPFAQEALAFVRKALQGKQTLLEADDVARDRYGRALYYVWLPDGSLFNLTLVEAGWARAFAYWPNTKYEAAFAQAEKQARTAKKGLWATTP